MTLGPNCKVCSDGTLRNQVDHLISDGLSDDAVSRALESIGIVISKSSILRHRQNHSPSAPPTGVELPADMELPRAKLEASLPMEAEANALMESLSKSKDAVDVAKERLARETLLGRILETHLVITTVALERFKRGEGRYPTEMIKGLTAVGTLFEKTAYLTSSTAATRDVILQTEITRRVTLAHDDAKNRAETGQSTDREICASTHFVRYGFFRFGESGISSENLNAIIEDAWEDGIAEGKKVKRTKKRIVEQCPEPESIESLMERLGAR